LGSISIASDLEGKDLNGFFAQCKSMDKLIKHSFIVAEALDEVYDISDEIIGEGMIELNVSSQSIIQKLVNHAYF
jgi:hypothetical protein